MHRIAHKDDPMHNSFPASEQQSPSKQFLWIPIFWTAIFAAALTLSSASLFNNHPEHLHGWSGLGFAVLVAGVFAAFLLLNWGWQYHHGVMSGRRALLYFGAQTLLLLLLVLRYDASFAWITLTLLYQIIGGVAKRHWPLAFAGLALVLLVGLLPITGAEPMDFGGILGIVLLIVVNVGVALMFRLLFTQRHQLQASVSELQHAHAELAASAAQAEELAVLRERTRLARAMHDNIGHALVVMNVKLEAAQLLYARDPARGESELAATRALIRATMTELRHSLADLRAPVAAHDDLPSALHCLAKDVQSRSGIQVTCHAAMHGAALPPATREALWYVAREALANVEKHAAAASATIALEAQPGGCLLRVLDDGSGVSQADLSRPQHYGILGMRERIEALGGTLRVQRCAGGGTLVEARVEIDN